MAKRLYFKDVVASEISFGVPEYRVLTILHYFKKISNRPVAETLFRVDFNRKEIANFARLRVDTVNRTIKSLGHEGQLKSIGGFV